MKTSIATVSLSGSLDEKLHAAAAAGFDAVEIFEPDLIASPLMPAEVRELADELGLAIPMYQPFRDFEGVGLEQLERNLRRARHKLEVMDALGADTLLVCSNVSANAIDDPELSAAQLRRLADEASEHGIRIAFEALAWGRHVNDYETAWRIVESADHPSLGTCLDSFHILSAGSDPAGVRDIPAEKIFFVQLADAPVIALDVLQWSRHYRCFPTQGGFDLASFMGHVRAAGYEGPVSLEVFNDVFRRADPDRIAVDAMRSLLVLEDALGERRLHPPGLRGFAFVELAVSSTSGPATQAVLEAMGFAQRRAASLQAGTALAAGRRARAPEPRRRARRRRPDRRRARCGERGSAGVGRACPGAARLRAVTTARARRGRPDGDRGAGRDLGAVLPQRGRA